MKIGYTSGVFDLFHVGHLNLLQKAKANCDFLVVAVCSDNLTFDLKGYYPVVEDVDRMRILSALSCVDRVVLKGSSDEFLMVKAVGANIVFKGSDWKGSKKWVELEKRFKKERIKVKFFPYTKGISSTKLRGLLGL
jgi:glycerol-3-phosphate cytidylyltransferase